MILRSEDYYIDVDTGKIILTGEFLMKRGYCCNSRCRHCPYKKGAVEAVNAFESEVSSD